MTKKITILLFILTFINLLFLNLSYFKNKDSGAPVKDSLPLKVAEHTHAKTEHAHNTSAHTPQNNISNDSPLQNSENTTRPLTSNVNLKDEGSVIYIDGETRLDGHWVSAECNTEENKHPTILIIPPWRGIDQNTKSRAEKLSQNCYNAFVISLYPQGTTLQTRNQVKKESRKLYDPKLSLGRMQAALRYIKNRSETDPQNIAVLGYSFGGKMALALARSGANIKGLATYHNALKNFLPDSHLKDIKTAIRVYLGGENKRANKEIVNSFNEEMARKNVDSKVIIYPGVYNYFTDPLTGTYPTSDNPLVADAYNKEADEKSWADTLEFLKEIFEKQD